MANRKGKGENSDRFLFLGLQNHFRQWLESWNQKMIAFWQESDDKPRQCVEKQKQYYANKGPYSQEFGPPSGHVWLWELDHKEGECQRIDAFKLWCWRKLLKVPWLARKSNQSILREISPEYSLKGLIMKLKLQYFGPLTWTNDSLEKSLMLEELRKEGEESIRGWDGWTVSPKQWTWSWGNSGRWWGTGRSVVLQSIGSQRIRHDRMTEQQQRFLWSF